MRSFAKIAVALLVALTPGSALAQPPAAAFATGVLGAVATAGRAVIDLLSTPVVVTSGPPRPHAELIVAPDRAGLAVRF